MILHLSSQQTGGAANSAIRIHQALRAEGIDSLFLTAQGKAVDARGIQVVEKLYERFWQRGFHRLGVATNERTKWEKIRARYDLPPTVLSGVSSDYKLDEHPLVTEAQILHLHWVTGMFDWEHFFRNVTQPIVWTLHDMNPFMGIFHYEGDLRLGSQRSKELDQYIRSVKIELLGKRQRMVCVSPSYWLSEKAKSSEVFQHCDHQVVRYAVDTDIFKPYPQEFCRKVFTLPEDRKLLLVIAERLDDYRKGMDLLADAIEQGALDDDWEVVCVGAGQFSSSDTNVNALGTIYDPRLLALVYSAVDLFVIPSREDNFPNVIVESLCCGTPVVGFRTGGIPEAIELPRDGVVAQEVTAQSLGEAITLASRTEFSTGDIRTQAVARFNNQRIAEQYKVIYEEL